MPDLELVVDRNLARALVALDADRSQAEALSDRPIRRMNQGVLG